MPLIVNNKEVKKLIHDNSGLEVLEIKDGSGKLLHKRVNLEFKIDEFRPYTETIDTWGTLMDVPDDPILENTPTIYLVGWSYDGVNALPEPLRVPIEDSTLYAIWSDALVNIFNLDIKTTVRLNSKSTNAVVIGSTATLEHDLKKGVDASSGNINKYINTDLTLIHTSSNEVKLSNSILIKPYLLIGQDFSVGSLDLGTSMVSFLDVQQDTGNIFNESMLITLDKFTKGKDVSYSGSFDIISPNDLMYDSRIGISLNEVLKNNPITMLRGEDFSISLDSLNTGIESDLDIIIGDVYTISSVTVPSIDEFIRGKDVSYSGSFDIINTNDLLYDSRIGISLSEVLKNNPLSMTRGEEFSISLGISNISIESELDTALGDVYTLSLATGPTIDKFIRGKNVNYSGSVNLLGEDLIEYDLRMGISLNEVLRNNNVTFQKGSSVHVNLNPSVSAGMNLDTYLQNGKGFNMTVRPNVSNLNTGVEGVITKTPTIRYVACNLGNVQVALRNNDSSPVTMYLKTGSTFYSVGTQVQPGATLIYTVRTGVSGNYYYSNWIAKAKASNKEMSGETAPVSGSVSCPVAQLKWVYVPNYSGGGFGLPSFDNPEGKACSMEGAYTSYVDINGRTKWFRCQ